MGKVNFTENHSVKASSAYSRACPKISTPLSSLAVRESMTFPGDVEQDKDTWGFKIILPTWPQWNERRKGSHMGKKVEMAQTGKENKKTSVEEPVTSKTTKPKSNDLKRKRTCTHTHICTQIYMAANKICYNWNSYSHTQFYLYKRWGGRLRPVSHFGPVRTSAWRRQAGKSCLPHPSLSYRKHGTESFLP